MSDEELRESVKSVIRESDASPKDLRELASDLETLADQWEQMDETL